MKGVGNVLREVEEEAYVRCLENQRHKTLLNSIEAKKEEIDMFLPEEKRYVLLEELRELETERENIESDYTSEAVFFYGVEWGMLLVNHRKGVRL